MSKKLIKIMIIGVSALVSLFVILWVISLFRDNNLSFEKIENKIVSATEQYYKNNPELLPTEDYSKKELNIDSLVKEGYIKSLNKYVPAGVNCSGKVVVLKNENNYTYIPKLFEIKISLNLLKHMPSLHRKWTCVAVHKISNIQGCVYVCEI